MSVSTAAIVTVTLNPAIDQTVFVDQLLPGTVHRVNNSRRQAAGKGVNVATMLVLGGAVEVVAAGFLGEDNASFFEQHFEQHGLQDAFVRVSGETRTGIKILDAQSNETTDLNMAGAEPTPEQCQTLKAQLLKLATPGRWFVLAGSLPVGVSPDFLGDLIRALRATGAKVAVDSSGAAFAAAVEAGVDLAKPNEHELSELLGVKLDGFDAILAAARTLCRERIPNLVVSMGAEGALFLSAESELIAQALKVDVVSTVGAGDSLLAGYLQGQQQGYSFENSARLAAVYAWSRLEALMPSVPAGDELRDRMDLIQVRPV